MLRFAVATAMLATIASGATLTADYRLNGTYTDSLPGGTALTSLGGTLGATSYSFAANQGLQVASSILANDADYSIAMRFQFGATSGYRKFIDFLDLGSDTGMYVLNNAFIMYSEASGGSGFTPNTFHNVVVTRNGGTSNLSVYLNGTLQFSAPTASGNSIFASTMTFFRDDNTTGGGEASGGIVDRILIYDGALSAVEVGNLDLLDESELSGVPEPSTFGLMAVAGISAGLWRRRRSA